MGFGRRRRGVGFGVVFERLGGGRNGGRGVVVNLYGFIVSIVGFVIT